MLGLVCSDISNIVLVESTDSTLFILNAGVCTVHSFLCPPGSQIDSVNSPSLHQKLHRVSEKCHRFPDRSRRPGPPVLPSGHCIVLAAALRLLSRCLGLVSPGQGVVVQRGRIPGATRAADVDRGLQAESFSGETSGAGLFG